MLLQTEVTWANQQNLHPLGLAVFLVAAIFLTVLPRRQAILPVLLVAMVITEGQRLVIAELDLPFLRMLIMLGWMRAMLMGDVRRFRMVPLDKILIAWALARVVTNVLRENAVVYSCGWMIDTLGAYFLFRFLVRNWDDIYTMIKWSAILAVPVAGFFLFEKITQRNLFFIFGGVDYYTLVRDGKVRAMGSFSHPILAGCYFAAIAPLYFGLWSKSLKGKKARSFCVIGLATSVTIVFCCTSSTPLGGMLAGFAGVAFFRFRKYGPYVRWGTVLTLIALHFAMNHPVWHLLARIDFAGGSTGYHRFLLVDQTIQNFREWAFVGTVSTAHWGYHLFDVTGEYVIQCVSGGLIGLTLFVSLLVIVFREVGHVVRICQPDPQAQWMMWLIGCSLLAHCVNFVGVSYFGKPVMLWNLHLATVGSLTMLARRPVPARAPRRSAVRVA